MREAEAVELQGETVDDADTSVGARQAGVLRWAADTYMQVGGGGAVVVRVN